MTLQDLLTDYLAHQRGQGLSPKTVELTGYALRTFLAWGAKHKVTEPGQLDNKVLDQYSVYLLDQHRSPIGRPLSRESCRTYVRTLATFLSYCQEQNELSEKVKARSPKAKKRHRDVLTREEIDRLEDAAELERDKLLIRVMGDTGVRLSELLGLRPSDLIQVGREHYIRVNGKTGPRQIRIMPALFVRLKKYAGRGDRIFNTIRRSPKTGQLEGLKNRSVENMLGFLVQKAGIDKKVSPHTFRHSLVTFWLQKHRNPIALQLVLGWSSLAMLEGYQHLAQGDADDALLEVLNSPA